VAKARFETELIEGHKGVKVVLVPFEPEQVWSRKPVRLAGRRHGWLIKGTANRVAFDGYIGERWGRFFVILDDDVLRRAKLAVGDSVSMVIEPTSGARVLARATELSKRTTQPKSSRLEMT